MSDEKMQTNKNNAPVLEEPEQSDTKAQQSQSENLALEVHHVASGRRPLFGS